jgi:hypothetical protein
MVGPKGLKRAPEYYARALELAEEFAQHHVPERVDRLLDPVQRARSSLLRAGRADLLQPLGEHDQGIKATPVATEVRLTEGRLSVRCVAAWTDAADAPLGLRRIDGRLVRTVPPEVAAALPATDLDVTDAAAEATVDLSITARESRVGWPLPTEGTTRVIDAEDSIRVESHAHALIDPTSAGLGSPLTNDLWEVACRSSFVGFTSYPLLKYDGPDVASFVHGRLVVAFASQRSRLTVDVGGLRRSLLKVTRPDVGRATLRRAGARSHRLHVPVHGAGVVGVTRLPVRIRLRSIPGGDRTDVPAEVVADGDGVRLVARLETLPPGKHRLLVDDSPTAGPGGGLRVTPLVVEVTRGGWVPRMRLRQEPLQDPKRPVWG